METTIQKNFLKAFERGGVVSHCIDYIRQKYDLGYLPQTDNELPPQLAKYYSELHDQIFEDTKEFDDSVIMQTDSPLINEIEQNLKQCTTPQEQDRYLFSLLKPFKEFGDIFYLIAKIDYLNGRIIERNKRNLTRDTTSFIFDYEAQIERVKYISKRFCEINRGYSEQHNTVEDCLNMFVEVVFTFANRLDALLLTYGIDLMRLQKESGIYLKEYRLKPIISKYIGSMELAQKYIDELPKADSTAIEKTTDNQAPPKELQTDKAKELLNKAITAGFVSLDSNLYQWNFESYTGQLLAYFCERASHYLNLSKRTDKDGNKTVNWKVFEKAFNVKNIKSYKNDWMKVNTKFTPKGYDEIDKLFE